MKTTGWIAMSLLLSLMPVKGEMAYAPTVPVARVLRNATTFLKYHPQDAQGWYTLGRIHYVAFVNEAPEVTVYPYRRKGDDEKKQTPKDTAPGVVPDFMQRFRIPEARREESIRRTLDKWKLPSEQAIHDDRWENSRRFYREASEEEERLKKTNWKPEPELLPREAAGHAANALAALDYSISLEPGNPIRHLTRASLLRQYLLWLPGAKLKEVPPALKDITPAMARRLLHGMAAQF